MKCDKCNGSGQILDPAKLGTKLRLRRKKLRISLIAVADKLSFSSMYLCDLEHGRRGWTAEMCSRYLKALEDLS